MQRFLSPREWLVSILVFLAVYSVVMLAFARGSFLALLRGLLINLGWVFSSPFNYVSKTIQKIASISGSREHSDGTNEQYLTSRFLVIMRSAVVAIAIGILASSVISAWDGFLPSEYLRNAIDRTDSQISQLSKKESIIRDDIGNMDKDWAANKQQMKQKYDDERTKAALQAKALMQSSESNAIGQGQGATLSGVKELLNKRPHSTIPEIVDSSRVANTFIEQTATGDTSSLSTYIVGWRTFSMKSLPSQLSDEELRAILQPNYRDQMQQMTNLASGETSLSAQVAQMRQHEEYHPFLFLLFLLLGMLKFMVAVWLLGMLLEFLLISIFIARDVQLIRKDIEKQRESSTDRISAQ